MKIKEIYFNFYRAFFQLEKKQNANEIEQEQETTPSRTDTTALKPTLSIDDKKTNFLIYGENGSGKSSIFYGLQEFFASSENSKQGFNTNRFAEGKIPLRPVKPLEKDIPYIKLVFDDDSEAMFSIDENITNSHTEQYDFIKTANKGKGFLSYKELLKVHFLSGNPINLFELLIGKKLDNGRLQEGLLYNVENPNFEEAGKDLAKKAIGDLIFYQYPYRKPYDRKKAETNKKLLLDINKGIKQILESFYQTLSDMLEKFSPKNENGVAKFVLEPFEVEELTSSNIKKGKIIPKIRFQDTDIPDFNDFLNEARLTALAICIYLASLKTIPERDYKILFLDDVFIGLDMGNRIPLLTILKEYFADYQVFITTYDRAFFELAKRHLGNTTWKPLEVYIGEYELQGKKYAKPVIIQSSDYYERAKEHFEAFDYPSAGNYLRKYLESLVKEALPESYRYDTAKDEESTKLEFLLNQLNQLFKDCGKENDLKDIKLGIDLYKDAILNPASHYDLKSPLYRKELEDAFIAVGKLQNIPKLNIGLVLKKDTVFEYANQEKAYKIKFKLKHDLTLITEEGKAPILLLMKSDGTPNSVNPIFSNTENCLTVVEWKHDGVHNGVYNKKNSKIEALDSNSDAYKKLINDIKSVNELEKLILEKSLNLPTTGNFIAELALTFESIVQSNLNQ